MLIRVLNWVFISTMIWALPVAAADLIVEEVPISISQAGRTLTLEALLVRPGDNKPHPLALINHGSPRDATMRGEMSARSMIPQAREFAQRGWAALIVLRRGYGASQGEWAETYGGCDRPNFDAAASAAADDLRQSVTAASRLPFVDASRIISVGVSAGGFATMALSANPPRNLVAVINFAGGRGSLKPDTICGAGALTRTFVNFGKTSRVPSLWVYAANDHFFNTDFARTTLAAFNQAGGQGKLIVAEPFGNDGHTLFSQKGIPIWTAYVDSFLRDQGLTLSRAPVAVRQEEVSPPAMLSAKGREAFADFLAAPDHKAFVASPSGAWGWRSGRRTEEEAIAEALKFCKPKSGESCKPVMVDSTPNTDEPEAAAGDEVSPPSMLSDKGREAFADFLAAPDHKAFVASPSGAWGWRSGRRTEEEAIAGAMEACKAKPCKLIMVDSTPR